MTSRENRRSKYFSERSVQGVLLMHIVSHWVFFLVATGFYLYMIEMLSGEPDNIWSSLQRRHGPTVLAVLVLSPIILRDMCKLSHRFAGPIVRLRKGLRELADGRTVAPIKFRERDFWQDLASEFNRVAARMEMIKCENFSAVADDQASVEPSNGHATAVGSEALVGAGSEA